MHFIEILDNASVVYFLELTFVRDKIDFMIVANFYNKECRFI